MSEQYINLPVSGGGQSTGFVPVSLKFLSADTNVVSDGFNTTLVPDLDALSLEANKKYKITWALGSVSSPSAGLVWRLYLNYPANFVSVVNYAAPGAGATINTITPSSGDLVNANNPQLTVDNIFICEFQAMILMGSTSGDVEFGIRNVTAGTAELLAAFSYVYVQEVVETA